MISVRNNHSDVSRDLAGPAELDLDALRHRWRKLTGRPAPHLPRQLLVRLTAYRIQADEFGDLDGPLS